METARPMKPQIFTLCPFIEKVRQPLVPSECPLLFSRKDRQLRPLPGHVLGKGKILETSLLINLNICQVNNIMGTLGLLRVHGLLADWLGSERILAWLNSEMTEKLLRSQDEEGVQAL